MSFSRVRNRQTSVTPSVAALGAGGAARSAVSPARSAATSRSPTSADSERRTGTFRTAGLLGAAASSL
eukprot:15447720-Alexandrium_andersonii.AAC.1